MLQQIRERTGKWVLGIIVGAIAVSMLGWGIGRYVHQGGSGGANTVAKVGDQKITQQQYMLEYRQMRAQMKQQLGGQLPDDARFQQYFKEQALNKIIRDIVLEKAARRQGFVVNQQQLVRAVRELPVFQENGTFSKAKFKRFINNSQLNKQRLFSELHKRLMIRQPIQGLQSSAFVLPREMRNWAKVAMQKRDFQYLVIKPEELESTIEPNDKALKQYYEDHQQQFQTPETVRVNYVMLTPKALDTDNNINDDKAKAYYQKHKQHFMEPESWKVRLIRPTTDQKPHDIAKQLKNADNFDATVNELETKDHVNDSQIWVKQGDNANQELIKQLETMSVGEIKGPIATKDGQVTAKVIEHKPAKAKPFSEVKQKIKTELLKRRQQRQFVEQFENMADLAYRYPTDLQPIADKLGLNIQQSDWFSRDSDDGIVEGHPKVIHSAFSKRLLKQDNTSKALRLAKDKAVILKVTNHKQAQPRPFAKVKDKVSQAYVHDKAQEKAKRVAHELKDKLKSGDSGSDLLRQYGLKWRHKTKIRQDDEDVPDRIKQLAFSVNTDQDSAGVKVSSIDDGVAVVKLNSIEPGRLDSLSQSQRSQYQQKIRQKLADEIVQIYVKSQMDRLDIEVYDHDITK